LRPWTIDFHVAQNDATVKGSGSHDKTGRHCLPDDPNGKLDIARHAGFWLRDEKGKQTKKFKHICWDGCMFPNATMQQPATWNHILAAMVAVRDQHGWIDRPTVNGAPGRKATIKIEIRTAKKPKKKPAAKKAAKRTKPKPKKRPAAKKTKSTENARKPASKKKTRRLLI